MAASLNKVFLIGNLTRDPEMRYVSSGQPVVTFTIAVNRSYANQSGEKKEDVSFIRIVAWAKLAEICNEYLSKGSPVFVEGRLQSRSWEAQDGSKRNTIEVVATSVQFLGRAGNNASRGGQGGAYAADIPQPSNNDVGIGEIQADPISQVGETSFINEEEPPF